jgi:chemotaxis protein MotB
MIGRTASAAHKDEDSYLASLSDLIIGVLFIFIILLMAFALNYRVAQTEADVKQQELKVRNAQLSDAQNDRKELLEQVQKTLREKGIQVEIDIQNGVLRLPESLLFDSGKADLREGGVEALRIVASNLSMILPCYANTAGSSASCPGKGTRARRLEAIFIEGHTDDVPIHNAVFRDNWDLSVARAKQTYLELTKSSPDLERMANERGQPLLSFSAYAERRPLVANDGDAGRRKNRRIDLRFIMAVPKAMTTINETREFLKK